MSEHRCSYFSIFIQRIKEKDVRTVSITLIKAKFSKHLYRILSLTIVRILRIQLGKDVRKKPRAFADP
jgi:hypothetical protein